MCLWIWIYLHKVSLGAQTRSLVSIWVKNAHHIHIYNPVIIVPYNNIVIWVFRHGSSLHCFCVSSRQARQVLSLSSCHRCCGSDYVMLAGLSRDPIYRWWESSWPPYSFPRAQFCCPGGLKYLSWLSFPSSHQNHLFPLFEHFLKISVLTYWEFKQRW